MNQAYSVSHTRSLHLGIAHPNPILARAWDYSCAVSHAFDDLKTKQRVQGLTPAEAGDLHRLGAAALAAHHVVDALLDAHHGTFNAPHPYAGYDQ